MLACVTNSIEICRLNVVGRSTFPVLPQTHDPT
jgi:hypothetical protein